MLLVLLCMALPGLLPAMLLLEVAEAVGTGSVWDSQKLSTCQGTTTTTTPTPHNS
jgi:hypothetical protein